MNGKKGPGAGGPMLTLILVAIIAFFVSRCGGLGFGGFGNGLGILPGRSGDISSGTETSEDKTDYESSTSSEAAQEAGTMETDEEIHYVDLTINEDGYLYNNTKQDLADIMKDINEGDVIRLRIQRASKKDVDQLTEAAKEKGVEIINVR